MRLFLIPTQDRIRIRSLAHALLGGLIAASSQALAVERATIDGSRCRAEVPSDSRYLRPSGGSVINISDSPITVVCDVEPSYPSRDSIHYSVEVHANRDTGGTDGVFECAIAFDSPRGRGSGLFSNSRVSAIGIIQATSEALKRDRNATVQVVCVLPSGTRLDELTIAQHPIE